VEWGLRKYPDSANVIWDGDSNCEHEWGNETTQLAHEYRQGKGSKAVKEHDEILMGFHKHKAPFCKKCGAWKGQLGLEPNLELYLKHLLQITAELKRVLKPTGIMFWNMGDCYGSKPAGNPSFEQRQDTSSFPEKCMALQNYRLILKMIDEQGWILRNSIVWYKPNHLPESCKDRFTRAYENVFMLVKNKRYYFNLDAVREPLKSFTEQRKCDMERIIKYGKFLNPVTLGYDSKFLKNPSALAGSFNYRVREAKKGYFGKIGVRASEEEMKKYDEQGRLINETKSNIQSSENILGKNPSDVWTINTEPFPEAHFATFPTELVRRCIKAGCPENGVVLDPFVGSGTTIKVAIEERRNAIGIEIVPEYIEMTIKRCNLRNNPLIDFELKVV
jgi:site-specific DNA-methyltransferase (cytosine-N4-specific)